MKRINESGRSMVEMLGVLAIVGVLSIAGVSGYTTAMKKHKANELMNETAKRAVVLSMKLAAGQDITNALGEFGDTPVNGVITFSAPAAQTDTFTMTLSGVDSDLCDQLKKSAENSTMAFDNNCGKVVFYKDLHRGVTAAAESGGSSTTENGGGQGDENSTQNCSTDPTICQGCQTCVNGICKDTDSECTQYSRTYDAETPSISTCLSGVCICPDGTTPENGEKCGEYSECTSSAYVLVSDEYCRPLSQLPEAISFTIGNIAYKGGGYEYGSEAQLGSLNARKGLCQRWGMELASYTNDIACSGCPGAAAIVENLGEESPVTYSDGVYVGNQNLGYTDAMGGLLCIKR